MPLSVPFATRLVAATGRARHTPQFLYRLYVPRPLGLSGDPGIVPDGRPRGVDVATTRDPCAIRATLWWTQ